MVLALTLTQVGTIAGIVIGLSALGLSAATYYRQPVLRASVVLDGPSQMFAIAVTNAGTAVARAPWFLVALDEGSVLSHVGRGFLAPGEGRYALTSIPFAGHGRAPSNAPGVVGCLDSRGRSRVWSIHGGRRKVRRHRPGATRSFRELFRLFYPDVEPSMVPAGIVDDKPLDDEAPFAPPES